MRKSAGCCYHNGTIRRTVPALLQATKNGLHFLSSLKVVASVPIALGKREALFAIRTDYCCCTSYPSCRTSSPIHAACISFKLPCNMYTAMYLRSLSLCDAVSSHLLVSQLIYIEAERELNEHVGLVRLNMNMACNTYICTKTPAPTQHMAVCQSDI